MAILSSLPGISITVHNAQGQLPEYADAEPDAVKNLKSPSSVVISNYIEAPPDGGPFWLKFRVEAPYMHSPNSILFRYDIPGTNTIIGRSCGPLDLGNKESWELVFKGYTATYERGEVFRSFQFAKLKILPGDDQSLGISKMEESKMDSIGVFEIRVLLGAPEYTVTPKVAKWPSNKGSPKFSQPNSKIRNRIFRAPSVSIKNSTPVTTIATEKIAAKKSLSLNLSYKDTPLNTPLAPGRKYTIINGWDNPIAIFQFKYRTKADLQRLLLIEKTPEPEQLPKENIFPKLPTTPVPTLKQEPEQGQQTQGQPAFQPAEPPSGDLSAVATPVQSETLKRRHVGKGKQYLQTVLDSAVPLCLSPLDPNSRAFEELKFAEVQDLARKQHKSFDKLNGDEVEKFVRQKLAEEMVDADGGSSSHTSFDDLTFVEVWDRARRNYKDFDELNRYEIEELAREGYSKAMVSSPAAISGTPDERNGQGKRKTAIKLEDTDDDVVFVSVEKKKKLNSTSSYGDENVKRETS